MVESIELATGSAENRLGPLVETAEAVTGIRHSLPTLLRWCTDGRCGILLKRQRVGGRWYTTQRWVREWLDAVNSAAEARITRNKPGSVAPDSEATKRREAQKQKAVEELRKKVGA